jgi:hypothetical protein
MCMCANGVCCCVTRFVRRSDGVGSEFTRREQSLRHFFRSFQKHHCAFFACTAAAAVHALRHVRFRLSIHAGIAIPAAVVDIPISVFYCIARHLHLTPPLPPPPHPSSATSTSPLLCHLHLTPPLPPPPHPSSATMPCALL